MNRYREHIAHLLLSGFLFPQAVNAIHYLIQSHSLKYSTGESYEIAVPPYDYHLCDYQFNSINYSIKPEEEYKLSVPLAREAEENIYYTINVVNELAFHYSLRGPPQIGI